MFENCSYSARGTLSTKGLALLGFLIAAALLLTPRPARDDLSTAEGRCGYIARCGWDAAPESEELREIELPESFDRVLEDYNAMQLAQGYDLREAAGKRCLCCSYELRSYPGWDGRVIATIYIYRSRVIGGDIHTADISGFMRPLRDAP